MLIATTPSTSQNTSGGDLKSKFLITIKYSNGQIKKFTLSAKKILSADKKFRSLYPHLLFNAEEMITESI